MTRRADTVPCTPEHLAAWRRSGLNDTPPDHGFDRLTRSALTLLAAPVVLVSLADGDTGTAATRDIPVVMLSADAARQAVRLLGQSAHSYLTKPLNIPTFYAMLRDTLDVRT